MTENIDAVLADWQGSLDAMRWAPGLPDEPVPADSFYDQIAETFNSAADDGFYSRYSTGPDAIWIPVISDPVRERFERDSWSAFWDRLLAGLRETQRSEPVSLWQQNDLRESIQVFQQSQPARFWLDETSRLELVPLSLPEILPEPDPLPPGVVRDDNTLRFDENVPVRLPGIRPRNARLLEDR